MAGIAVLYVCERAKCSLEDCHGITVVWVVGDSISRGGDLLFENGVFSTFSLLGAELHNFTVYKTSSNNHNHYFHAQNAHRKMCKQHSCSFTSSLCCTNRATSPPIAPTNSPPPTVNHLPSTLPPPPAKTHSRKPPPSRKKPFATR